jgi:hypothetical protein
MRTRSTALATLAVTLALALGAASATASRSITISPAGEIRGTTSALTFTLEEGKEVICAVTLAGTLARAIAKVTGTHVGQILEARTGECRATGGAETATVRMALSTPWRMNYHSFTGTLPNVETTLVQIIGWNFLIQLRALGSTIFECLFVGEAGAAITARRIEVLAYSVIESTRLGGLVQCGSSVQVRRFIEIGATQRFGLL